MGRERENPTTCLQDCATLQHLCTPVILCSGIQYPKLKVIPSDPPHRAFTLLDQSDYYDTFRGQGELSPPPAAYRLTATRGPTLFQDDAKNTTLPTPRPRNRSNRLHSTPLTSASTA